MSEYFIENTKTFTIGGMYFAVNGQYVDRVIVLAVNKGKGIYHRITYSVVVQIVGTNIVKTLLTGFIFDSEFNAKTYLNKQLERQKVLKERNDIDTTKGLLRYILENHLRSADDIKERQFIITKAKELGYDVDDQLGKIIYLRYQ